MHWLERIWRAFAAVFYNGSIQPKRGGIEFTGDGVSVSDDAARDRIVVNIPSEAFAVLDGATSSPTENALVRRNALGAASFAAQCGFEEISATGDVWAGGNLHCDNLSVGDLTPYFATMRGGVFLGTTAPPNDDPVGGCFLYQDAGNLRIYTESGDLVTIGGTSSFDNVQCVNLTCSNNATLGTSGANSHVINGNVTCSSNLSIGSSPSYGGASVALFLGDNATPPSGTIAGGGVLYLDGTDLYLRVGSTRYAITKVAS